MRLLKRTERTFYYRTIIGRERKIDADGYKTGEYDIVYSEPIEFKGNLGSINANVERTLGGNFMNYSGVIFTKNDLPRGAHIFNEADDSQPEFTVEDIQISTNYYMVGVKIWQE